MKRLLATVALTLAGGSAALAFDADTQAIIDQHKRGKLIGIEDVAHLMRESAQWCYLEEDNSCAWIETYLDVRDSGVGFELANNWDADTDYAFTDEAVFTGNRLCQTGFNWIDNLRAMRRVDGGPIGGRDLFAFKQEMAVARPDIADYNDCFDYLYVASDAGQQVVTLLQRQYVDGVHDGANDVEVTVHFNPEDAAGLTLRE